MGAPIKYDDLRSQWSRRQWKPHYLFTGQEEFLIEQAVDEACTHWLADNSDPLNKERLDADDQSLEEILQACRTAPFFGGARVILIRNASQFTAKGQEELAQTIRTMSADTHVILIWGREWRRDDANKAIVSAITAIGEVVIFWPMFSDNAERWCLERAKFYKKTLQPQAAHWLVQQAGEGLRRLDQELAKCTAYVGDRPEIALEDVQTSFGYGKASSPYDWVGFIRQRKAPDALHVLDELLEEGEEPVRLLALLSRSVRDWLGTKGSGENSALLAMRFRIKRGEENRFVQELSRWSETALTEALGQCVEAEVSIKTGKETPEMALTLLTLSLSAGQALYAGSQA